MEDYVLTVDDVAPARLCSGLCRFLDRHETRAERTSYGVGESTSSRKITLVEDPEHHDEGFVRASKSVLGEVMEVLTGLVHRTIVPAVYPVASPVFAPIQLRKMLGPTRNHSDNISPFLLGHTGKTKVAYRVVTIIVTLSHSDDVLVFPRQQRSVELKRGSAVLFPPYWMFEHHTTGGTEPRYAITTWLYECVTIQEQDYVRLRADGA